MAIGGKNSDFRHGTDGAPAVLTDFTGKMRSASLDAEGEEVDATVWGDGFRKFEQSFKNATIESEYKYDDTVFMQLGALFTSGQETDWQLSPDGVGSSKPLTEGAAILLSIGTPINIGDLLILRCRWRVTGPVTFDLHPA